MKNKLIPAIVLSSMMILGGTQVINANIKTVENNLLTTNLTEKYRYNELLNKCPHNGKMMKGHVFKDSVDELQKSGVLSEEDVKNIYAYHAKIKEQRKEEMKKKRDAVIDDMVSQNVITKEKAKQLKATIEKNIEKEMK